ncbi:MAG: lipopolysaccharide biosynthesis protein [Muribaculaceae bacterium]|nr:lipopolysaccharide biosynthesis protein [Muribaculaceae bacterium]
MIRKLLSNSLIYGLAPNIPKVAALFILPLLTAHLTEEDYGIAGTIVAYTLALSAFSTLGFSVILQNAFFKQHNSFKELWSHIYGFLQLWMIVFSIIQSVILYFIIPEQAIINRWWIILLTNFNGVILGPAGFIGPLYYQLEQHPIPIAVRSVIGGLLSLAINYITIVTLEMGYMGWYISSFLGTFIVNISYWWTLKYKINIRPNYHFNKELVKNRLKIALPTIPHYYSVFLIQTSSRLVMDWFKIGLATIGTYNIAQQITSYVETGINAVERAAGPPSMQGIQDNKEHESKRFVFLFIYITFSICFLIALWSKEIFNILIKNPQLASAYPYAAILIMALCYRPMYFAASNIYFFYEETKKILKITFFAGIIAFLLNLIFIPLYGLWAAVIINYITFIYQGYSAFFIFNTFKKYSKITYPWLSVLILQMGLTFLAFSLLESPIIYKIVSSSIFLISIICIGFFFFKIRKNENYQRLSK